MFIIFFFFQAEDGIRDLYVTGVQTCALPIYIATSVDVGGHDHHDMAFDAQFARIDRHLYLEQRKLFARLERNEVETLEAEETIIALVTAVLNRAHETRAAMSKQEKEARLDLVQRAK